MANNKSAEKKIRVAERNRIRNKGYKTTFKNIFKKIEEFISSGNKDEASKALSHAQKSIDKAADIGAIHKNKAARKKSRLTKKINAL